MGVRYLICITRGFVLGFQVFRKRSTALRQWSRWTGCCIWLDTGFESHFGLGMLSRSVVFWAVSCGDGVFGSIDIAFLLGSTRRSAFLKDSFPIRRMYGERHVMAIHLV